MLPKFDPNRPHGQVTPGKNGVCFWQNGHHYNANHDLVEYPSGKVLQAAEKPAPVVRKSSTAEKMAEQNAKLMQAQGGNGDGDDEDNDDDDNDADAIDLLAWAKGEAPGLQWFKVKKALAEQGYDPVPAKADDARAAILAKHAD